jgi:2-amino-4-hydroxy-6-hydroxymethyldihydropteridine diphosphokinase
MPEVFVGVGSNVDRESSIAAGLKAMSDQFGALLMSGIYETEPVGFVGDPFFNLVVGFQTSLAPIDVAERLTVIERDLGRRRETAKFAARKIDLDLLLYGSEVLQIGSLRLPREDVTRYAFVLEPLTELAADLKHPVSGKTFAELWAAFDRSQVRQRRVELCLALS